MGQKQSVLGAKLCERVLQSSKQNIRHKFSRFKMHVSNNQGFSLFHACKVGSQSVIFFLCQLFKTLTIRGPYSC